MDRWEEKTAIVTGASSGIGKAIVQDLVKHGINVVAVARRLDSLQKLKEDLSKYKGKIHPLKVDLNEQQEIIEAFNWISNKLGPVNILINNAAINIMRDTSEAVVEEWKTMFNVNVFAPATCIKEFIKLAKMNNINDGRIINISSIVAHRQLDFPGFYVYTATKYALNTLSLGLRRELTTKYPKITLNIISPGYVKDTELFNQHSEYDEEMSIQRDKTFPYIMPEDVSSSVIHILNQSPGVMIEDIIIQSSQSRN